MQEAFPSEIIFSRRHRVNRKPPKRAPHRAHNPTRNFSTEQTCERFEITRTTTFQGSDLQEAFKGYRENKAGEKVEITVEVLDAGDGAGAHRYAASAYSQDGKEAHGNEAVALDEAILNVQWEVLD